MQRRMNRKQLWALCNFLLFFFYFTSIGFRTRPFYYGIVVIKQSSWIILLQWWVLPIVSSLSLSITLRFSTEKSRDSVSSGLCVCFTMKFHFLFCFHLVKSFSIFKNSNFYFHYEDNESHKYAREYFLIDFIINFRFLVF